MQAPTGREGPKYQYGRGASRAGIDPGDWMAQFYGIDLLRLPGIFQKQSAGYLPAQFQNRPQWHASTQRPGWHAMGHEPGLPDAVIWGGKPTLPLFYSDEVWTGIEYQVASSHREGLPKRGLTVNKGLRVYYDGRVRNPWNEYECGELLRPGDGWLRIAWRPVGFSLLRGAEETLWFGPQLSVLPFKTFFSTASGFSDCARGGLSVFK